MMESSPKNMEKRMLHMKLYKNARGRTPPWKEVYRQRCMERLRSSRLQLVNRFRASGGGEISLDNLTKTKMVQEIMEVEWTAMNHSNGLLNSKNWPGSGDGSVRQDNHDAMVSLMEEIQQELMSEEEKLLNEVLNYNAAELVSHVASHESDGVICPVCQVQNLKESAVGGMVETSRPPLNNTTGGVSNLLTCSCGLALQGANLTLSTVKSSLENTLTHHGQTCQGKMSFTPTTDTQGTNVLITCSMCEWMSFLL